MDLCRRVVCVVSGLLAVAAGISHALPDPDKPVDPSKRARVSTAEAMQPAANTLKPSEFANPRIIRPDEIVEQRAAIQGRRAPVVVEESRAKKTVRTDTRRFDVRTGQTVHRAGEMPSAVPRLDPERFQKMVQAYRNGVVPADSLLRAGIDPENQRATLEEINRFANPRGALEAQGLPVTQAGSGENEKEPSGQPAANGSKSKPAD